MASDGETKTRLRMATAMIEQPCTHLKSDGAFTGTHPSQVAQRQLFFATITVRVPTTYRPRLAIPHSTFPNATVSLHNGGPRTSESVPVDQQQHSKHVEGHAEAEHQGHQKTAMGDCRLTKPTSGCPPRGE